MICAGLSAIFVGIQFTEKLSYDICLPNVLFINCLSSQDLFFFFGGGYLSIYSLSAINNCNYDDPLIRKMNGYRRECNNIRGDSWFQ